MNFNFSRKSFISLILGIFCFITRFGFILFIPGILFGISALLDIKKSDKIIKGGYIAILGILLSVTGFYLNLMVAIPALKEQKDRSNILKVKSDMKLIKSALEKYYIDNNCYPLTTPINYIQSFPIDPFSSKGSFYSYYTDNHGWILISLGPYKKYSIIPDKDYSSSINQPSQKILENIYDVTNGIISNGDIVEFK